MILNELEADEATFDEIISRDLLFRGQSNISYRLLPSFYRKFNELDLLHLSKLQKLGSQGKMILDTVFLTNLRNILSRESNYKEVLDQIGLRYTDPFLFSYVQHYCGLPLSPYLDWTYSFSISLLFALFKGKDIPNLNINDKASCEKKLVESRVSIYVLRGERPGVEINLYRNGRMQCQKAVLILINDAYYWEDSKIEGYIDKYNFDPKLGFQYFFNILENNPKIKSDLEIVIQDLKSPENYELEVTSEINEFSNYFYQRVSELLSGNVHITYEMLTDTVKNMGNKPITIIKGFNPENFICLGNVNHNFSMNKVIHGKIDVNAK